jgi:hypothetical protein
MYTVHMILPEPFPVRISYPQQIGAGRSRTREACVVSVTELRYVVQDKEKLGTNDGKSQFDRKTGLRVELRAKASDMKAARIDPEDVSAVEAYLKSACILPIR